MNHDHLATEVISQAIPSNAVVDWKHLGLSSWKDISYKTVKGNIFYPLAPDDDLMFSNIDIEDIAIGLSNKARFNGQIDFFYSVAQHSVHVSDLIRCPMPEVRLTALLHDAAEYVLGDLNTLLKPLFPAFRVLESRVQMQIHRHFGLEPETSEFLHKEIKLADNRAVLTESETCAKRPGTTFVPDMSTSGLTPPGSCRSRRKWPSVCSWTASSSSRANKPLWLNKTPTPFWCRGFFLPSPKVRDT